MSRRIYIASLAQSVLVQHAHARSTYSQQKWLDGLATQNDKLRVPGEKPLQLAEAIALRLYTGPLLMKDSAVCRSGPLHGKGSKIMQDRFMNLCASESSTPMHGGGSSNAADANRYTTTIHVLASALVKARKLSKAGNVWRGTTEGVLPKQF